MKKTGLFGGTFDPIHLGHINLAEQILQSGLVEQIIFIPAKYPPHKNPELISAREDRLAMLQIAIQGNSA
ncbi:MAG: adenylyltransferase/cytidyltransferase family protein, partial [Lentisphaeria bacterium]|nr:adenylyltransferase/cytidyltransferase family protein [Lentisphaeria bacterium]